MNLVTGEKIRCPIVKSYLFVILYFLLGILIALIVTGAPLRAGREGRVREPLFGFCKQRGACTRFGEHGREAAHNP